MLGFSDMQADVARELIKAGVAVYMFNQRSVEGILAMIETLGRLVGAEDRALALVAELEATMDAVRARAAALPRRPRVYFEEWDEPPISAVGWVSELIGIAGGEDVFAERSRATRARRSASWPIRWRRRGRRRHRWMAESYGRPFRPETVGRALGWEAVPAIPTASCTR